MEPFTTRSLSDGMLVNRQDHHRRQKHLQRLAIVNRRSGRDAVVVLHRICKWGLRWAAERCGAGPLSALDITQPEPYRVARGCTEAPTGAMTVKKREANNPSMTKTPGCPLARGFLAGGEPVQ